MPAFLAPLIMGGVSALGGLFGNKNKQQQESQQNSQSQATTSSTGTSQNVFDQTSTQGFNPQFQGTADDILSGIFSRMGPQALNPEELRTQELVERQRVNRLADQVFGSARGGMFSRGLASSPSGEGLSRGLAEMFRGSGILDVAGKFAQRRFELPIQQEALNNQQRSSLLSLFNMLPRSTQTSGTSNTTNTQNSTTNQTGSSTGMSNATNRSGNPIMNAIAGGLTGFGQAGGFNNIPGLSGIFGQNTNGITNGGFNPTIGNAGMANTGMGDLTQVFGTPPFNPNAQQTLAFSR